MPDNMPLWQLCCRAHLHFVNTRFTFITTPLSPVQVALRELQALVEPNLVNIKATLETRASLSRGPTLLERLDFVTRLAR